MNRWKVRKIGDLWEATDRNLNMSLTFNHWKFALNYANAKARTTRIHIPSEFSLTPAQTKQVEILLAHHYRKEEQ